MDISPTTIGRFVIATGAAAGWLISSSVTPDAPAGRSDQPSVARPTDVDSPPAKFTETLRERMREPVVPERGRNPFTYGARVSTPPRGETAPHNESEMPITPLAPPLPVFKLSGIATTQTDDGPEITAIVIDNGTMVFAQAGDRLSNGYSVVRVDETSITLIDAAGVSQTLRLP